MKFLITGGAGFIGSAVIRYLIKDTNHQVLNFDKLTYASNLKSVASISNDNRYRFVKGDICDFKLVSKVFFEFKPNIVMHLAAETHVDRSINDPSDFIKSNIIGTSVMLQVALDYWRKLPYKFMNNTKSAKNNEAIKFHNKKSINPNKNSFRFHHISTDEVYGSITNGSWDENFPLSPNSPYAASKASADLLCQAFRITHNLDIAITRCANNYGSHQSVEKFIPKIISSALANKKIPVYGDGSNFREWLHVKDHVSAIYAVSQKEISDQNYIFNIGGTASTNLELSKKVLMILGKPDTLIKFVEDRKGHDLRYSVDWTKINRELGYVPRVKFEDGLRETIQWYRDNEAWWKPLKNR
jgi:dTDP-glucose 4,6-dehydratase